MNTPRKFVLSSKCNLTDCPCTQIILNSSAPPDIIIN